VSNSPRTVEGRAPALAQQARWRAVELRASEDGGETDVELTCLRAIYIYERTLFKKHGKRVRASYTWRNVSDKGIISAVEAAFLKKKETAGYRALVAEGMADMAFQGSS
jgi:hypothetical protein